LNLKNVVKLEKKITKIYKKIEKFSVDRLLTIVGRNLCRPFTFGWGQSK